MLYWDLLQSLPYLTYMCLPFFTWDKPGANSCRVIVDLSFPHGTSVNTVVDPDPYLGLIFLTLPSKDYITNRVLKLGRCLDISRAFCHIKFDPADYTLSGVNFNSYYIDMCLPFGFRHR